MNCDPASLAAAARCLCFPGHLNMAVKTYLLCEWAGKASGLIPQGAVYDEFGEYDLQPLLTPGESYRVTNLGGAVEPVNLVYTGHNDIIHIGTPIEFAAVADATHLETVDGAGSLVNIKLELIL